MKQLLTSIFILALLLPTGVWAAAVTTSAAGSPGQTLVTTTFTANGTYTPTSNFISVTGCGAGGGGAGGHTADPGGGGGGGGGAVCVVRQPIVVVPGTALTITIGTAGVGAAAGSAGGIVNLHTTIAGLPLGTYSIHGPNTAPGTGTVTNGGAGGCHAILQTCPVTGTGTGAAGVISQVLVQGGDATRIESGSAGGGATGPANGGIVPAMSGYSAAMANLAGGASNGTKGGGGTGGNSLMGTGAIGGSNAVGTACTGGYGAGGGGGAPTFAGGNGCPGYLVIQEWK